ncbi:response regulator [Desulfobacter sp.]|uniref:response regulator n=1 Tax=Desulfobacter sp. TaxID=2294 RepID=UPI003D0D21F6
MKNIRVLLVDDEERFVLSTRKFLTNRGFDVLTAFNGMSALEVLEANDIHVVVLDVKMPGMDGISVLKEIKARFPLVEVVMLTGNATFESAVAGIKIGASDYLMKPAELTELAQKIEEAFRKRKLQEEKLLHEKRKQ